MPRRNMTVLPLATVVATFLAMWGPGTAEAAECNPGGAHFNSIPRGGSADRSMGCDFDVVDATITSQPAHGSAGDVEIFDDEELGPLVFFTYTSTDSSFEGFDEIHFTLEDGDGGSHLHTYLMPVGLPHECDDIGNLPEFAIRPGQSGPVRLQCTDPDQDPLTLTVTSPPSDGSLGTFSMLPDEATGEPTDNYQATYTAAANPAAGERTFDVEMNDGHGGVTTQEVNTFYVGNQAPSCTPRSISLPAGTSKAIPLSCSDPDSGPVLSEFHLDGDFAVFPQIGDFGSPAEAGTNVNPLTGSVTFTAFAGRSGVENGLSYYTEDEWGPGPSAPLTVTVTPGGGGGGPTGGGPTGGGPTGGAPTGTSPPDTTRPGTTLGGKKTQKLDKLAVTVTLAEAGTVSAGGTVQVPGASKVYRFKKAKKSARKGQRVKLRLKLSRKARRAVKRALRRRKLKAKIKITATDKAGNKTSKRKTIRLKR
jgi:hypothetical protein